MHNDAQSEQQRDIVDMARTSVPVASCLRRITNWCLTNGIDVKEGKSALAAGFQRALLPALTHFLRHAVETMFVCGFVPWYQREVDGVRVPAVLPLGSFRWTVEPARKGVFAYRVFVTHGDIKAEQVHIVDYVTPRLATPGQSSCSPLHSLYEMWQGTRIARDIMQRMHVNNSHRHMYFSETINPGELGAPSGLHLLDEFRRYSLTGQHSDMRMRSSHGASLHSVNDAHIHWIKDVFQDVAQTHMLPPNVQAFECKKMEIDPLLGEVDVKFMHAVHVFFDLPYSVSVHSVRDSTKAAEHVLSEEQYTNVRALCDFLQELAGQAYSKLYKTTDVSVTIRARPRLSFNNTDDVKTLMECGALTARDMVQIRQQFMQQ
jgi:hypothetical protein